MQQDEHMLICYRLSTLLMQYYNVIFKCYCTALDSHIIYHDVFKWKNCTQGKVNTVQAYNYTEKGLLLSENSIKLYYSHEKKYSAMYSKTSLV